MLELSASQRLRQPLLALLDERQHGLASRELLTALQSPPGAPGLSAEDLSAGARRLRERSDRAIIGLFGGNLLETGQFLYRNDNFLMLLAGEPTRAHAFLDKLVEHHLANLERFLGAVGPYIDIILFGNDLGMQTGPQMSPAMYREFFKPRHAAMWKRAKELAKVMLHCCGGVRTLLPHLIDAGLDAINPVQISCRGAEARVRQGPDILGWRLRYPGNSALRHTRASPISCQGAGEDPRPRRRVRLPASPQHRGQCPAREHHRDVRRGVG